MQSQDEVDDDPGKDDVAAGPRLLGVLDHVASDEALLLAFADENGINPEDVGRARDVLAARPGVS